jgi:hypothetical protein
LATSTALCIDPVWWRIRYLEAAQDAAEVRPWFAEAEPTVPAPGGGELPKNGVAWGEEILVFSRLRCARDPRYT